MQSSTRANLGSESCHQQSEGPRRSAYALPRAEKTDEERGRRKEARHPKEREITIAKRYSLLSSSLFREFSTAQLIKSVLEFIYFLSATTKTKYVKTMYGRKNGINATSVEMSELSFNVTRR